MSLLIKSGTIVAITYSRLKTGRAIQVIRDQKNDKSMYYHEARCGWIHFDKRPVTGTSQFVWLCWLCQSPAFSPVYKSNTYGSSRCQGQLDKLEQWVSTGGESSFVLFPIMLMALKSLYVHAWVSNGPDIPQCCLVGNQGTAILRYDVLFWSPAS